MKTIDETEMQKKPKKNKRKTKRESCKGYRTYSERVRAK